MRGNGSVCDALAGLLACAPKNFTQRRRWILEAHPQARDLLAQIAR
jgi:hypothetical protein